MKTKRFSACLSILLAMALFTSCKKDVTPDPVDPPAPVLSSKDPQAISAAVKVWHGERVQGNAPSPKGAGLELDASSSAPITQAFNGRFAIINPQISSGDVAGYYLKINGSKEYFKIDYTKPRGVRLVKPKKHSGFSLSARSTSTQDNADSAIVIALPATLKVPDTICVTYCAYDVQGNISNPVTTCIVVNSLGSDANGAWLNGVWKNTASWDTSYQQRDTIVYNKWLPYDNNGYSCNLDPYTGMYVLGYNSNSGTSLVTDSALHIKSDLTLGANGGATYQFKESQKWVDASNSTCSQFSFRPMENYDDTATGAWNFNSATGKMVIVFEFDDNGTPTLDAWEYKVQKVNNNHFILLDDADGYPYYYRFEK